MTPVPPLDENAPPSLAPPDNPDDLPLWRASLEDWRQQMRERLSYSDAEYRDPAYAWADGAYVCGFVFMYDQQFYDAAAGGYLLESFLSHSDEVMGGFDAVVLWHAYPRIGFDARSQFDFYRDMPGGLDGLREVCRALQARGVRVFINYNPWDTGTRREAASDSELLVDIVRALRADGIFLDTMAQGQADLRQRLDAARPGAVLESEGALPLSHVHDHHMSWAQNFADGDAPGVLRNKYFERRHMQHAISRWKRDRTPQLHSAWMNGSGMLVWENVFGTWVGWSARDRGLLRAMLPIQRRFGALFRGEGWTPLVSTLADGVYASQWQQGGLSLWTLANRNEAWARGALLAVAHAPGQRYFDLITGQLIQPALVDDQARLSGEIGPRGIGAVLAVADGMQPDDLASFLARQAELHARMDFDTAFPARQVTLEAPVPTRPFDMAGLPAGMAAIPGATFEMTIEYRIRECGFYENQSIEGYDLPEMHTRTTVSGTVNLGPYGIDLTPVTNSQYADFLSASGYAPAQTHNFLKHWVNGVPPRGLEDHPVVYVDLEDARAYARWSGKRLPTEAEWQYAAQGPAALRYPWGDEARPGAHNPGGSTTPVMAYPAGRSPWRCWDMCGNVWQWTESERSDGRTRFCMLRGGCYYRAEGSDWYADGGLLPANFAAKFLMMWPGLDRCATIGFRCAVDMDK